MLQRKPVVFSRVFRFILMVIIALFLIYSLISIGLPKWITFLIIVILYLIYTAVWPAHIIYRTRSLALVDRYIKRNSHQTIFEYPAALKEGDFNKIEVALKKIMNEFPEMENLYGAHLSAHQKDAKKMLAYAENIQDDDYRNYYKSYAHILKGFYGEAMEYERKVEIAWMKFALKAYAANRRGEYDVFKKEAIDALEKAGGIQKYTLFYTLKLIEHPDNPLSSQMK